MSRTDLPGFMPQETGEWIREVTSSDPRHAILSIPVVNLVQMIPAFFRILSRLFKLNLRGGFDLSLISFDLSPIFLGLLF
jgi:hypothetical protein